MLNNEKIRVFNKIGIDLQLPKFQRNFVSGSGNFGSVFLGKWNNIEVALKTTEESLDKLVEEGLLSL